MTFVLRRALLASAAMGSWGEINHTLAAGAIVPTLGTDVLTNGTMETGAPPSNWTAANNAVLASVADERTGGAGVAALGVARNGTDAPYAYQDWTATLGAWYRISLWQRNVDATHISSYVAQQSNRTFALTEINTYAATAWREVSLTLRAPVTALTVVPAYITSAIDTCSGRADDVSIKPLTLSTMLVLVGTRKTVTGTYQCTPTVINQTQCGIAIRYADADNFVLAIVDLGLTNSARLLKCIGGTWTEVISGAITYSAGAMLRVVIAANGVDYSLYYGGAQIGATTGIADAGLGTGVCGFSTDAANEVSLVQTNPT